MVAYNFVKQFESKVKDGSKKHTIRKIGKRRHARRGEVLQLYTGMRTKSCRKIKDADCFDSVPIQTLVDDRLSDRPRFISISIGGNYLHVDHFERFATEDGFDSLEQMEAFFYDMHGPGIFKGSLIIWDPTSVAVEKGLVAV